MMPQDLFSDSLVASPESQTPRLDVSEGSTATGNDGYNEFTIHRQEGKRSSAQQLRTNRAKVNERNDLHPYVQTLSLSNLESCVALENAVFSELERCAREKVGPPDSDLIVDPFLSTHSIYPLSSSPPYHWPFRPCKWSVCFQCKCFLSHHLDLPHCLHRPESYQSFICTKSFPRNGRKPTTSLSNAPLSPPMKTSTLTHAPHSSFTA